MAILAFCAPVVPGMSAKVRSLKTDSIAKWGEGAHAENRKRIGITMENAFIQQTPMGEVVTVIFEGADPAASMEKMSHSDHPYDVWFRAWGKEVHGIDFAQMPPGPAATQIYDLASVK